MNRRTILGIAVIVAVFVAGALVGVAGPLIFSPDSESSVDGTEAAISSEEENESDTGELFALARYLDEELGLSDEQRARLEEVLAQSKEEARTLFLELRSVFRDHIEATVAEIKNILTPEQAAEYQRMLDALERRGDRSDGDVDGFHDDRIDRDPIDDDGP